MGFKGAFFTCFLGAPNLGFAGLKIVFLNLSFKGVMEKRVGCLLVYPFLRGLK